MQSTEAAANGSPMYQAVSNATKAAPIIEPTPMRNHQFMERIKARLGRVLDDCQPLLVPRDQQALLL
jgi:hypothetical protein